MESNRPALDQARVGLSRESVVPVAHSSDWLAQHMDSVSGIRSVARLLGGESLVYRTDGRYAEASRSLLDEMSLGQAMTQGGMGIDVTMGWVVQKLALRDLQNLKDRLPSGSIVPMIKELEALDRRRVSLDDVVANWSSWYRGSNNLGVRAMYRLSGIEKKARTGEQSMAKPIRDQVERSFRFTLVDFAIHAFHQDRNAWPLSLDDLVPEYLASVPIDSGTGRSIDYPRNQSGELTDDLSAIARPDGAVASGPPR
ncbi:hypothetical protein P12x_001169 [Tundrisphaera lichenicola]|uniref:hypothetical protein n=1 Tax=Tundrisphaera lichenicola TaxID=2029860 RepID=UPI003EBCD7A9